MLGLQNTLKHTGLKRLSPTRVTSGLVLKSNFDTGAVTPISDGSVSLSGASDQHVACGTGMTDVTSGAFTISGWYRIETGHDVATDGKLTFFSRGVGAGTSGYYMKYEKSGANYRFILFQAKSGGYNSISHNATLSPGTWYHIAWVNGGTGAVSSFYLDGVQVETKTLSQDILTAADVSFKIGISSGLLEEWKGNICNVGMWTSALTSAQVKSIMYKNYSGLTPSEKTNLVSWWNLSALHIDGSTVVDNHGSNHGTLS
jgi:hypothetical protein